MVLKTNKALCAVLGGCTAFQMVCKRHKRANLFNRVLYVLEQVKKTGTADYITVNEFLCREWKTIRDILAENNVLSWKDGDSFFIKDPYSINSEYSKRDCVLTIPDSLAEKWSKRSAQSKRISVKKHTARMYRADSVPEGVKLWQDTFQQVTVNRDKLYDILEGVTMDEETKAQQMEYIRQIEHGECYFPILNKGRLYTPFHSLKKELRACLEIDGEPLKEMCDVKSAFPSASACMFASLYPEFKEETESFIRNVDNGLFQRIEEKKGLPEKSIKKVFMLLWFCSASERSELLDSDYKLEYSLKDIKNSGGIQSVSLPSPSSNMVCVSGVERVSGDSVTKVCDSMPFEEWLTKVCVSLSVKQKKRLGLLYGDNWLKRPANDVLRYVGVGATVDRLLKKHVPCFWMWVKGYSHSFRAGQSKSNLPVDLMRREGDGVFRLIMPAVSSFFRRGVLTLHDALFAAKSEANGITSDMFNYLYRDAVAFQAEKAYYLQKFDADKGTPFYEGVLKIIANRERQKIAEYRRYIADFIYKRKNVA